MLGLLATRRQHQDHQRNAARPEHRARLRNLRSDHARNTGTTMSAVPPIPAAIPSSLRLGEGPAISSSYPREDGPTVSSLLPLGQGPGERAHDQFIVSFGKIGALGVFTAAQPLMLRRGQAVIVQTSRGVEIGTVLCQATLRQARLLGATSSGALLRLVSVDDEARRDERAEFERRIFEA